MIKMSAKIIENVVKDAVGEDILPLVRALKNKKNVSEFKLAERIDREVNQTRNLLYRLYQANLVSFIRRKDKKKGWYIYYWTFRPRNVRYLMTELKKKRLESLKERVKRESESQFYICSNKCLRLSFDQSFDFEFKCPECGEIMNHEENSSKIIELEQEIKDIEKELRESS